MFAAVFSRNKVLLLDDKAEPKQVCLETPANKLYELDQLFQEKINTEIKGNLEQQQQTEGTWSARKFTKRYKEAQNSPDATARLQELRNGSDDYKIALATSKNSQFNVYLKEEAVAGSHMHQDVRHHSKILLAVGILLAGATAALALTHVVTLTSLALMSITGIVAFLVIFGLGALLVSHYMMSGKEVIAVKYSDISRHYAPALGNESAFIGMEDTRMCYIPKNDYKRYQKTVYKAEKEAKEAAKAALAK